MLKLNYDAFKQAESIILHGKVDMTTNWSMQKPNKDAEAEFLGKNDEENYRKWFLAYDPDKNLDDPERWQFLYGDFEKLYRSALLAFREMAEQHQYADILIAIKELLRQIDKEPDAVEIASNDSFPASDPPGRSATED